MVVETRAQNLVILDLKAQEAAYDPSERMRAVLREIPGGTAKHAYALADLINPIYKERCLWLSPISDSIKQKVEVVVMRYVGRKNTRFFIMGDFHIEQIIKAIPEVPGLLPNENDFRFVIEKSNGIDEKYVNSLLPEWEPRGSPTLVNRIEITKRPELPGELPALPEGFDIKKLTQANTEEIRTLLKSYEHHSFHEESLTNGNHFGLFNNGKLIGMAGFSGPFLGIEDEKFYIFSDWVIDPSFRKKRLGHKLLSYVINKAFNQGAKIVVADAINKESTKVISKLGRIVAPYLWFSYRRRHNKAKIN